jgi:methylated-DNA-[protein]-cysteine S-methyltransferase
MTTQHYTVFATAFGACGLAWDADGLTRLRLPAPAGRAAPTKALAAGAAPCGAEAAPPAIARLIADVRRYFAGEEVDFSAVAVALPEASAFERAIYAAARAIGYGYTATYGELARRAGFPGSTRETGQALGRNPVPLVVPCHRIVASDGRLGGFSAPGGNATKERMLALEGSRLNLLA